MYFLSVQCFIDHCRLIFYDHTLLHLAIQWIIHHLFKQATSVIVTDTVSAVFDQCFSCVHDKCIIIIDLYICICHISVLIHKDHRILQKTYSLCINHIIHCNIACHTAGMFLCQHNTICNNISIFIKWFICVFLYLKDRRIYPHLRCIFYSLCIICVCLSSIHNLQTIYTLLCHTAEIDCNRSLVWQIRNRHDPSCSLSCNLTGNWFFYSFIIILRIQFIPCIIRTCYRILDHRRYTAYCNSSLISVQSKSLRQRKITDHQISGNRSFLKVIYCYLIIYLFSNAKLIFHTSVTCCQI